ncbi:hypothetical protein QZH41_001846 [Actinostola sp. cb2023]|nr:hypothetical protein QZH41_001846 [Actinostola sp. cb2023]
MLEFRWHKIKKFNAQDEQMGEISNRLKELETLLAQQGGAQATPPNTIKVTVPRERKLQKYSGERDDKKLEDWIGDATRAIDGKTDADAVDYLVYHLEGAAKDEVRLRPATEWNTPALVMKILRACFSEQLTETQAMRTFFERRQGDRESTTDYAHAIMVLLSRVEQLSVDPLPGKDRLLRDQFVKSLNNVQLRRDTKRWVRDHPEATFQQVREEVQGWLNEDNTPARRAPVREVKAEGDEGTLCGEVRNTSAYQKIIADLVAGQKTLAEGLQKQQEALERLSNQLEKRTQQGVECYGCGKYGHFQRNCPQGRRRPNRDTRNNNPPQPPQQPALNGNSPQQ